MSYFYAVAGTSDWNKKRPECDASENEPESSRLACTAPTDGIKTTHPTRFRSPPVALPFVYRPPTG